MKTLKKLIIAIMVTITIAFTIFGVYSKVFADYGIYGFQKLNSSSNDGRYPWPLELGVYDYVLHVNWACYTFNNIYCIQKGYSYNHDGFNITYGIWIDGNDAILYRGGWNDSNIVARWSCPENNVMAGIVYYGNGWTTGLQVDGDMKSGSPSVAQTGVHQYWDTFEAAMNRGTGNNFDFGFSSSSATGSYCVQAVRQNIENNGIGYRAQIVIMENTKGYNSRQNLIGVSPKEPGKVVQYTNVKVTKQWVDNNNKYGTRPSSIKVDLYKDGEYFKSAELDSSNNWSYTFEELEKDYKYEIKEDTSGITSSYVAEKVQDSETSYKLVNTLLTEIKVVKQWDDKDDLDEYRPDSLNVTLYSNGVSTGKTVKLSANNQWTASFGKLRKYDNNGKEIKYTVREGAIDKYTPTYEDYTEDSKGNITFTIKNTHEPHYDGYIEITGKVWEDTLNGKDNSFNGTYNKENDNDILLPDIKVRLKYIDENGKHRLFNENLPNVYETKTDSNGEYKFTVNYDNSKNVYKLYEDVKTIESKLKTAYVEFEYDGLKYTTVANADSGENTSKAVENETQRNTFDSNHSRIEPEPKTLHADKWTDKNITAVTKPVNSYTKGNSENRTVVVKYCNGNGTCDRTHPEGAWVTIEDQLNKYPCQNCQGKGHTMREFDITVETIPNINLGLFKREQPDVAIFSELSKVEVIMRGQQYTYLYNVRTEVSEEKAKTEYQKAYDDAKSKGMTDEAAKQYAEQIKMAVKFQNKDTYTYKRPVNPADIAYLQTEANKNEMSVYVTYEVKVANLSTTLPITVHNIINSYDSRYTLNTTGWTVTQAAGFQQATSGDLNITVNPLTESSPIELKYTVSTEAIRSLLNQEATLNNAVEIGSYSTKYGAETLYAEHHSKEMVIGASRENKDYGGYDYDSHPGNAGIFINNEGRLDAAKMEDDTDIAPAFVLCPDDKPKTLAGTIFEDGNVKDNGERIGNGYKEDTEKNVENVKVELYDINGSLVKLYNSETQQFDKEAIAYTNSDGSYELEGVVTGEYFMKFTYGDDTTKLGHEATTMDGGATKVNARNHKSTIIVEPLIKNILSKDYENFSEEEKKWHITHEDGYSVAVDNMKDRLEIGDLYYTNFNNPFNMTAFTKPFKTQVEFEATGESKVDILGNILSGVTETLDKLDFGIIERPREDIFAQKTVTNFKITLATGQILTEGNPSAPDANIPYAKTMGFNQGISSGEEARKALEKQVLLEIDSELIQGAELEVEYAVTITNNNEIDYDYEASYDDIVDGDVIGEVDKYITKNPKANYYYFGDETGLSLMQTTIEFIDYMDNDIVYSESEDWAKVNIDELHNENSKLINDDAYNAVKDNKYQAFRSAAGQSTTIAREVTTEPLYMSVRKVLSNKDDNTYDNNVEILKIDGKTARTIQESKDGVQVKKTYEPGNYVPSLDSGIFEQDDDRVKFIITPPTGITNYIITYVFVALIGLAVIALGVIFIKKKILTK